MRLMPTLSNRIIFLFVVCLFFYGSTQAATFTVNSTGDGADINPGDGVCTDLILNCTFRAALEEAGYPGIDTIKFAIPGPGVKTITPSSRLPGIHSGKIDGWSQGGVGYSGPPLIEINGQNSVDIGISVTGDNVDINGLIVNRFTVYGISYFNFTAGTVVGGSVKGCYVGTDSSGTIKRGNRVGIIIDTNQTVGGTNATDRNIISGNTETGVSVLGDNNTVIGNYIGTDVTGSAALGNDYVGLGISGNLNTIGGTLANERNVISGNNTGIQLREADDNIIIGNFIGVAVDGISELGNTGTGILIYDNDENYPADSNRIGGIGLGAGNIVAYSGLSGIEIRCVNCEANRIRRNSIFSNGSLGIDLTEDSDSTGVTINDSNDTDTGPNGFQNYPILNSAINDSGITTFAGTLNSEPNVSYVIDFFSGSSCDASGNGEGEIYEGSTTVTTNGSGNATINFSPSSLVPFGKFITATATRDSAPGNTSEFSQCIQVVRAGSFIVTNTNDSGPGSLRKAIDDANFIVGIDTITFNIPGSGVQTITPFSPLPQITESVIIDGSSQPGFTGIPLIELNGSGAGTATDGIEITGGGSTVKNLIINRFGGDGIELTSGENTILGCYIGTNSIGTVDSGNGGNGIRIGFGENNRIGSANVSDRNIISGNNANGIRVFGKDSSDNEIVGNYIGTDLTGTTDLGNSENGIEIQEGLGNIIGGATADLGNVISGNDFNGIRFANGFGNQAKSNKIGTDVTGVTDLGNTLDGIQLGVNANNNNIGGSTGGNTIAFNADGVNVFTGASGNSIRGNSIFSNDNLGLDLAPNGVTPNDTDDLDTGANNLQNFPVITNAASLVTGGLIEGTFNSTPNTVFTIDFYAGATCDSSGNGEGKTYLGSRNVTTNSGGDIAFSYTATGSIPIGTKITTTATDVVLKDTSEFSECVTVVAGPGNLSFSAPTYSVNEGSATKTITVNRTDGSNGTITVNYATSNGTATAGQDYTQTTGTLTFLNGVTSRTFDIPITNDSKDENNESLNLTLNNPTLGVSLTPNPTAVLTIEDNDNPPTISINDPSIVEGNTGTSQLVFDVQLSAASSFPISVDFATANLTANFNQDYLATNGQLSFVAGETSKTVSVTVLGDLTVEINETFVVNLSNPVNAAFGDNQGVGTIADDDNPGRFAFSLTPYSGIENSSVLITVSRSNGTAGTVAVDYSTSGGNAVAFSDYTPTSGNLVFLNGETTKTFTVALLDDSQPEPTENFNVNLTNPIGGSSLGTPSVASVNILDNDTGALFTISGEVKLSDNSPVANVTMTLQGASSSITTTNSLGQFSFPNLAPNGNYSVTPSAIGFTYNPINRQYNNLSADVTNANFTATPAPSRQLRIIGSNAVPTQNITANIELVAQGDENSVGFSLNYDSTILTNPTAVLGADALTGFLTLNTSQTGKVGVLLALPAGNSFAAGTRQIVTVTFNTLPTAAYNSPVTFGDIPIAKQVVNTNADPLPTTYLDGAVTFAQGYESDVAPRPTGSNNGSISVSDFTQVGRFVAGLDTINPSYNEFQRADSAPRVSLGNGSLTVSDYTQAGRYAAGIDAATPTGGQYTPSFVEQIIDGKDTKKLFAVPTNIRAVNTTATTNTQVLVSIETDAQGTENGFGFTLNYDQNKLSNPLVTIGSGIPGGSALIPNTLQAGRVGVVLGLPFGVGLTAGTRQLVTIRFDVAANAAGGNTPLTFGDAPVFREVSDIDANVLMSTYQPAVISIMAPTAASVSISGRVLTGDNRGLRNARVYLTEASGEIRSTITNPFGYYHFYEIEAGQTVILTVTSKRYQFAPQVLSLVEGLTDVNFIPQPD